MPNICSSPAVKRATTHPVAGDMEASAAARLHSESGTGVEAAVPRSSEAARVVMMSCQQMTVKMCERESSWAHSTYLSSSRAARRPAPDIDVVDTLNGRRAAADDEGKRRHGPLKTSWVA